MSVKPKMPTESWFKEKGRAAHKQYDLAVKHGGKMRDNWTAIGQIAFEVKLATGRGSGVLDRWRGEYLPEVSGPELSDAIWMSERPKAVALVKPSITSPKNIRQEWRDIAKGIVTDFIESGRNDRVALASEIGATDKETEKIVNAELRRREKEAEGDPAPTVRDAAAATVAPAYDAILDVASDDPVADALAALERLDVAGAIAVLKGAKPQDVTPESVNDQLAHITSPAVMIKYAEAVADALDKVGKTEFGVLHDDGEGPTQDVVIALSKLAGSADGLWRRCYDYQQETYGDEK